MNLTDYLDKYCAARQQHDTDARDNSKFRVSDAGKCRLMRYWKRQGKPAEPTFTPKVLRSLQVGILLHEWIQGVIKNAGIALGIEAQVEDANRIGHIDALVQIDDKIILYDFKSVGGKKWYYLDKNGFAPDILHSSQILTYSEMLQLIDCDELKIQPDENRILYLNRDTLAIKDVSVVDSILSRTMSEDWRELISCWDRHKEPAANPANWECGYCAYQPSCPSRK